LSPLPGKHIQAFSKYLRVGQRITFAVGKEIIKDLQPVTLRLTIHDNLCDHSLQATGRARVTHLNSPVDLVQPSAKPLLMLVYGLDIVDIHMWKKQMATHGQIQ